MTWLLLPGLDGTGEFLNPLLPFFPHSDTAVVVRYPPNTILTRDELLGHIKSHLPPNSGGASDEQIKKFKGVIRSVSPEVLYSRVKIQIVLARSNYDRGQMEVR